MMDFRKIILEFLSSPIQLQFLDFCLLKTAKCHSGLDLAHETTMIRRVTLEEVRNLLLCLIHYKVTPVTTLFMYAAIENDNTFTRCILSSSVSVVCIKNDNSIRQLKTFSSVQIPNKALAEQIADLCYTMSGVDD